MTYTPAYYLAWIVALVGVVAGVLAGTSQTPWHPAWLTSDLAATAGIVSAVCVGLAAFLPQVGRSPAKREQAYLLATEGILPKDLHDKHAAALVKKPHG